MSFALLAALLFLTRPAGADKVANCVFPNQGRPFLIFESGVSGGEALYRQTVLIALPDGKSAVLWLRRESPDGSKVTCFRGQLADFARLEKEFVSLGLFELPAPEPTASHEDPYGLRTAVHVHNGTRCYSYSPQRDCIEMNEPTRLPSAEQKQRYQQICNRFLELERLAKKPVSEQDFNLREKALYYPQKKRLTR